MFLNNYLFNRSVKNNNYLQQKHQFLSLVPKTPINNFSVYLLNNENIITPIQKKQKGIIDIIDDDDNKVKNINLNMKGGMDDADKVDEDDGDKVEGVGNNEGDEDLDVNADGEDEDDVNDDDEGVEGDVNAVGVGGSPEKNHMFGGSEVILDNLSSGGGDLIDSSEGVKNISVSFF